MKYRTVDSFFQGCGHPSSSYLIMGGNEDERARLFSSIFELLQKKHPSLSYVRCIDYQELSSALETGSLWQKNKVFFLENIGSLGKKDVPVLAHNIEKMLPGQYLFMGGEGTSVAVQELYHEGKQNLLFLDLTGEKPWEHEERLKRHLIFFCHKEGVMLSTPVAQLLLQHVGAHIALLEKELEKILCYIGDRTRIEISDVELLCSYQHVEGDWKIAEQIVWHKETGKENTVHDMSSFLSMCGLLRYHLEMGCGLSGLVHSGASLEQMHHFFPKLKPASLKKYAHIAHAHTPAYFQEKLHQLFKYEYLAKTETIQPKTLWSLVYAHLIA